MKRVVGVVAGVAVLAIGAGGIHGGAARADGDLGGTAETGGGGAGPAAGAGFWPGRAPVGKGAPPASRLVWRPCAAEPAKGGARIAGAVAAEAPAQKVECATLRVPLDYREPYGQTVELALNRVKGTVSRDHNHLGALLVNPGGPGASGRELAKQVASSLPAALAARFDVIGFDPRGVGASKPALTCVDAKRYYAPPRLDHVPRATGQEDRLLAQAREYATACGNRWSWMLPHMTTENSARDIESIRVALGEERISYLGYSYGTYLGAVYATLYPARLKRLVLDSSVDPQGVWYKANLAQNYAFDQRHRDFMTWIARNNRVYRLGGKATDVRFAWYSMRDRLRGRPVGGLVGPSELDDVFTVAGYTDRVWPQLADAFSAYVRKGATKGLMDAYHRYGDNDASAENGYAVYLSVQCRDAAWPRQWNAWRADTTRIHSKAPFLAWPNTWYNAPCAYWPVPAVGPVQVRSDRRLPPILMLQTRNDAATPYAGALRMRRALGTAGMVLAGGGNHGAGLAGNACVDRHLAAYLRDGTVPARRGAGPDARCAGGPAPVATPATPAPGSGGR
ncbi:alpha/beta hydrolase [Spongiactinospora sp. TRM90649]|uniref:alpha/beta hydrolase n=1 Tax=Spongiactinospora sp. TRM90649 TaxID=3031114 RepID=UPI0023F65741|nr:alpha/beta hydrolase [Spongiactinospora sp. TRM90649]MDF5753952.1 alpha/beta hydrolase [Spongiactinospora sp. TRM90649]